MLLLKGKRIFIVEDNPGNKAIASIFLTQAGATVATKSRGTDVPKAVLEFMPVDMILLDLMLPDGISGFDVFDEIKQTPELADIPIVAVTASDPDTTMPIARQKGFAGYIGKPISPFLGRDIFNIFSGKRVWLAGSEVS